MFIGLLFTIKEPLIYEMEDEEIEIIKRNLEYDITQTLKDNEIKIIKELEWSTNNNDYELDDCDFDYICYQLDGEIEFDIGYKRKLQNILNSLYCKYESYYSINIEID